MAHDETFERANQRARDVQASIPRAVSARYDRKNGHIVIHLSSNLILSFSPRDAQGLENAKPSQLEEIEVSPSGFGVHFPKLDADLYVPGLQRAFSAQKADGVAAGLSGRAIPQQRQAHGLQSQWKTGAG